MVKVRVMVRVKVMDRVMVRISLRQRGVKRMREFKEIHEKAMLTWSFEQQALVMCEEMGELAQALSKWARRDKSNAKKAQQLRKDIMLEIVDVWFLIDQMKHYFKFENDEFYERYKLVASLIEEKLWPEDLDDL